MYPEFIIEGGRFDSIPRHLKTAAHEMTLKRIEANKHNYKNRPDKKREGMIKSKLLGEVEREYYTDYIGILSEMIVRRHFDIEPEFEWYCVGTFIMPRGKDGYDVEVKHVDYTNPLTINVKACEGALKVNCGALSRSEVDFYLFLRFTGPSQFETEIHTKEEIMKWRVCTGYSPYYRK